MSAAGRAQLARRANSYHQTVIITSHFSDTAGPLLPAQEFRLTQSVARQRTLMHPAQLFDDHCPHSWAIRLLDELSDHVIMARNLMDWRGYGANFIIAP
jgi:hypothetical protein